MRRLACALAAAAIAFAVSSAGPASATDYRYWTYWSGTAGGWTFSSVGPASAVPADGDVEGWRFAVSRGVRGQGAEPRIAARAAYRQFCGDQPAASGKKRVAVVFDFGTAAEAPTAQAPPAPRGTCVEAPDSATGAAILSQAATVRSDDGLVCAIGGYPQGECAPAVSAASASPRPERTTDRSRNRPAPAADDASAASGRREPPPAPATTDAGSPPKRDQRSSTEADSPTGKAAPSDDGAQRPRRQAASPSPSPTTSAAAPLPAEPTFIVADAQLPTDGPDRTGVWPLLVTALVVAAAGGLLWWRRRP